MKILLITDNHSETAGGAEKYFFTLKKLLQQRPDMDVISLGFGVKAETGKDFIILKASNSNAIRQWWNMFLNPVVYFRLRRLLKKLNPDVIHLHNIRKHSIALLKALNGFPVVQTVHDYYPICPTMTNIHKNKEVCETGLKSSCLFQHVGRYSPFMYVGLLISFFRARVLLKKVVRYFIAPSPLLQKYLEKNGFIPVTCILPFTQKTSFSEKPFTSNYFLYVGRLQKNKGVDILVEEFAQACQKNSNLILKIAGEGELENTLKAKVRQLQLEKNILFLGRVQKPPFEECMAVIFPSIGLESFGLVITEAMAAGRVVIGSNRGPTAGLVEHEKTGLLFDPLKSGDLAKAILRMEPAQAEQWGRAAWQKLQTFPTDEMLVNEIVELYRKV